VTYCSWSWKQPIFVRSIRSVRHSLIIDKKTSTSVILCLALTLIRELTDELSQLAVKSGMLLKDIEKPSFKVRFSDWSSSHRFDYGVLVGGLNSFSGANSCIFRSRIKQLRMEWNSLSLIRLQESLEWLLSVQIA